MTEKLNGKISFSYIMKFVSPTIIMSVFMSTYTVVDGIFISKYVGETALSAVNIIFPLFCVVIGIGIMLAAGGCALVAAKIGENKKTEAREDFTMITVVATVIGIVIAVLGFVFVKPLSIFLGASETLLPYCMEYAKSIALFAPFAILQAIFQFFFMTSGKPLLGMIVIMSGGITNIVLDYVFIAVVKMGIVGAGLATGLGMLVPSIIGLIYFTFVRKNGLYFVKFKMKYRTLGKACYNGSSEMVANLASAVITYMFNITMMRLVGENGVAAITVVMYLQYLLTAVFFGYSSGVSPLISYNYGSGQRKRLKKIYKISFTFILSISVFVFIVSLFFASGIVLLFVEKSSPAYDLALSGFRLFSFAYLFMGINIFISAMFTALSKGKESAIISFLRTFLFIFGLVLILPNLIGVDGVWLAIPIAEFLGIIVSLTMFLKYRKRLYAKIAEGDVLTDSLLQFGDVNSIADTDTRKLEDDLF